MKRRKYIILAAMFAFLIVSSIYLSRTVAVLVTPKAQFIKPKMGTISIRHDLNGRFSFPDMEDIYIDGADTYPIRITDVMASAGDSVKKGDELFKAELAAPAAELSRSLGKALDALIQSKVILKEALSDENIEPENINIKPISDFVQLEKQLLLYNEGSAEYKAVIEKEREIEPLIEKLFGSYESGSRKLIFEWFNLQSEIDGIKQQINKLESFKAKACSIKAPYDGYVTGVFTGKDEIYDAGTPLYSITARRDMVVTADVTGQDANACLSNNTYLCRIGSKEYMCLYDGVKKDAATGRKTLILKFAGKSAEAAADMSLLGKSVRIVSTEPPHRYDSLIPASSIVRLGEYDCIYLTEITDGFWGKEYRVKSAGVDILASDGIYTAILLDQPLPYDQYILNYWDRSITDGQRVVEYVD